MQRVRSLGKVIVWGSNTADTPPDTINPMMPVRTTHTASSAFRPFRCISRYSTVTMGCVDVDWDVKV